MRTTPKRHNKILVFHNNLIYAKTYLQSFKILRRVEWKILPTPFQYFFITPSPTQIFFSPPPRIFFFPLPNVFQHPSEYLICFHWTFFECHFQANHPPSIFFQTPSQNIFWNPTPIIFWVQTPPPPPAFLYFFPFCPRPSGSKTEQP